MNNEDIVENMISFIEEAERDLQASKLSSGTNTQKTDIVNSILDKLEKEITDEN